MNEHADASELPELTNEDVELLYAICTLASQSSDPPFRALFAAYDSVFAEQQIEQEHDGVVFRYLMRVGESTRAANRERQPVDLVERLRSVLAALGITIVDQPDESREENIEQHDGLSVRAKSPRKHNSRRVSFDDARLDETWLSEHSASVNPAQPPPRTGRAFISDRRARSISSQRHLPIRSAAPKHFQHTSSEPVSESEDQLNPTLYFEPSQTQLEQNAEAFLSTSALRSARHALHAWHDSALHAQQARSQAWSIASAHDRRTLLKQALDEWRSKSNLVRQEKRREEHFRRQEIRVGRRRDKMLLAKVFTHWANLCKDEKNRTRVAKNHILKVTYFKRWRAIAHENQTKVRRILVRKYLAVWRERTARRLLWQEQAVAHYEESLMRRCKTNWFWHFCSRRVEGWHEGWIEKRAFNRLATVLSERQNQRRQAEDIYRAQLAARALRTLGEQLRRRQQMLTTATQHHDRHVAVKNFQDLEIQSKLAPIARTVSLRLNVSLQRKALRVWNLHLALSHQASEVDRKRILQTAWTSWNDGLRCKALAQKIDERVLIESLYRWVLMERLALFHRATNGRLLRRGLHWWRGKVEQERDKLADVARVFAERQRRRRLAFGMLRLNIEMRNREDAERAALEFTNARALPKVVNAWKDQTDRARRLTKWASDARFYYLCTSTLKIWNERTTEHKQNRKRNAYVQIRARVKIRLVGQCFVRWRAKTADVKSMHNEAEHRAQARIAEVGTRAFESWREKSGGYVDLQVQATNIDQQKLLGSALSALIIKRVELDGMDARALDFRRETDLALQAGALRRVQWATFTAARKAESAQALWGRNRDQHVKQMLRHWAGQTAARRESVANVAPEQEPESPSLRPASRLASRSAGPTLPSSPPLQGTTGLTPAYMRTPTRSRRAGRFRPLPTPAPFTPMAFNSAYLATTPAPIPDAHSTGGDDSFLGGVEGLTPQVTPFERKLRASGVTPAPPSALRSSVFARSTQGGTSKSVRFAGASRFRSGHEKNN